MIRHRFRAMRTLAERYHDDTGCPPQEFRRSVFWRTLHRRALPIAPLLLLSRHFEPDRALLDACGRATRLEQVNDELREHQLDPRNRGWLRRHVKLRLSTQRLRVLADRLFGSPTIVPDPFKK